MKTLVEQLAQYGSYHRDGRNILTHFLGVPMILLAVVIGLSRPVWMVESLGCPSARLCWRRCCVRLTRGQKSEQRTAMIFAARGSATE